MTDASYEQGQYRDLCYRLTLDLKLRLKNYPNIIKRCLSNALDELREEELNQLFSETKRWIQEK